MIRRCADSPIVGLVVNVRRLTLTMLAIVIAGFAAPGQASAEAMAIRPGFWVTGDGEDGGTSKVTTGGAGHVKVATGNGSDNQNEPRVFSPTTNIGVQHVSVVAKNQVTLAGFCKKNRFCKIKQKLWVTQGH